jgi:hypothetical protein
MSHRLIVNPGTPQAWEIELQSGVNRIGRTDDNDFPINHTSLSSHHCEITVTEQGVTLKDLGSTNGTFVERVPVTELQLQSGHQLQLGAVNMVYESTEPLHLPDPVNQPAEGARIVLANPGPGGPPAPPRPAGSLRINLQRSEATAGAEAAPAGMTGFRPASMAAASDETYAGTDRKDLVRGVSGAVVGGLLGMFIWYFLIKVTGYEIGIVAWGVGLLVGGAARIISKQPSPVLGIVCGVCAFVAIVGGQYLALIAVVDQEMESMATTSYREELAVAKSALEVQTREQIVHFLSVRDEVQPGEITEKDVKNFQEVEREEYKDFVNGKPSEEEYVRSLKALGSAFIPKGELFKESMSLFTLLWLFLGVGSAWKLGAGYEGGD